MQVGKVECDFLSLRTPYMHVLVCFASRLFLVIVLSENYSTHIVVCIYTCIRVHACMYIHMQVDTQSMQKMLEYIHDDMMTRVKTKRGSISSYSS